MFDFITQWISGSPVTYPVISALAVLDIIGIVPAETVIITATLAALRGDLWVVGVAAAAIVGALVGDNILYLIGQHGGGRLVNWLFRSERSRERLDWARRRMHRHRNVIIIGGRFLPGGRTVVMFAAGTLQVPWRRFIPADVVAVVMWAGYYVGTTVAFGEVFSGKPWLTLLLSVAVGITLGAVAEVVRRFSERRNRGGRSGEHEKIRTE
ncbi:DedA family protein [Haloactinomyces albus]|uniref:Membrane protein DedA with SNARE-associated domain n=1 Tax=Haloactinomyces albus TaxID=1352928 RepID=A0AAE4CR55_9ACTN|nr:DedA family protein [Haloactinomyces albus]MDR7303388.1 membrane protein DedA with SNARE-associated domain [Haloactinomyces albus]